MKKQNFYFLLYIWYFLISYQAYSMENQKNYNILNTWTQLSIEGKLIVRALLQNEETCPTITYYKHMEKINIQMATRENYSKDKFPILLCEQTIPYGATHLTLQNKLLPILPKNPTRFLILGDTGCRIKGRMIQDCSNPNTWPYRKIIQQAAKKKFDVVIHLGDYHYRETSCLTNYNECLNLSLSDNWTSWRDDFFSQSQEIFSLAPIVFTRGDHESCGRADKGWFYFLDPRENTQECKKYTEPYKIPFGTINLLIFDTSNIRDGEINQKNLEEYISQLRELNKIKSLKNNWFITHKPVWGIGVPREANLPYYSNQIKTEELQAAISKVPFDNSFDALLSGHIHLFQIISLGNKNPPQIISGNGGTLIEYYMPKKFQGTIIDGKKIVYEKTIKKYGFSIIEIKGEKKLKLTSYDMDGKINTICYIKKESVHCN